MARMSDGNGSAGKHFGGGSAKPSHFSTGRSRRTKVTPSDVPASGQVVAPHTTTQATSHYRMRVPDSSLRHVEGQGVPASSDDAPQAVDGTTSFPTIAASQGAVISNRDNADVAAGAARASMRGRGRRRRSRRLSAAAGRNVSSHDVALESSGRSRKVLIGLFLAAAVVIVALAVLVARAWNSTPSEVEPSTRVERTEASADEGVSYDGYSYTTAETDGGTYVFVRTSEDGSSLTLCELSGEPVSVVLCDGAFCIPENLSDGTWDVIVYTMGDGSVATQLVGSDGSAVTGTGTLSAAMLDGTDLVLTDASGNETRAALE